jgi:hypothetical protein
MKSMNGFFELDVLNYDNYQIVKHGRKLFYNNDGKNNIQKWLKSNKKSTSQLYWPTKNGMEVSKTKGLKDKMMVGAMGYFYNNSNCVQYNSQGVAIFSTVFGSAHGIEIMDDNFINVCMMMSARQLIKPTWLNEKDEYMVPIMDTTQFGYDSIILTLFSNGSYQTSLRNMDYKDQSFNVVNEFFWMSKDRMKELTDENGYDNLYNDARTSSDRHVYNLLFGEERIYDKLSDDAKAVLDKATELVEQSLQMRQVMADDHNHLDSWDAGYAQLKLVWKEYFEEDFKEFRQLYKNLEGRMSPLVYELGFLMK